MHREALAIWMMALALAAPGATSSAESTIQSVVLTPDSDDELEEVAVTARRLAHVRQSAQSHFDWLARLVGEFTVEGYVDISPRSGARELLTAEGTAGCIGFGIAPGVQCNLHIRWPKHSGPDGEEVPVGAPTLDPAIMLFGFKQNGYSYQVGGYEISEYSIKHVLIDNRGILESGHGVHVGEDTVVSTSHCAAVRRDCERMVRITAGPGLRTIEMLVELTIEQHKAARYVFLMNRVPGSKAVVYGREPEQRERK